MSTLDFIQSNSRVVKLPRWPLQIANRAASVRHVSFIRRNCSPSAEANCTRNPFQRFVRDPGINLAWLDNHYCMHCKWLTQESYIRTPPTVQALNVPVTFIEPATYIVVQGVHTIPSLLARSIGHARSRPRLVLVQVSKGRLGVSRSVRTTLALLFHGRHQGVIQVVPRSSPRGRKDGPRTKRVYTSLSNEMIRAEPTNFGNEKPRQETERTMGGLISTSQEIMGQGLTSRKSSNEQS